MSKLEFAYIDYTSPVGLPERKPNGGLYTGELATGPWKNVPVLPEPMYLAYNLLSAEPPPNAQNQPMSYIRPGNNVFQRPFNKCGDNFNFNCIN